MRALSFWGPMPLNPIRCPASLGLADIYLPIIINPFAISQSCFTAILSAHEGAIG